MTYIDKKNFDIFFHTNDIRIEAPIFEVDELIAPIISLLNKKGYKTQYCCSGHYNESKFEGSELLHDNCYIVFKSINDFKDVTQIKIPQDFLLEPNEYGNEQFTIRKYYKTHLIDRYFEIIETMKDLLEWVNKLPWKKFFIKM